MYTIALVAQKGGTGKTTFAVNLAHAAERDGKTALIVDIDPQSSACDWKDRRQRIGGDTAERPAVLDSQPSRLATLLATAKEQGVDFVVIDTPARLSENALAAVKAADLVIVPCRASPEDLQTIPSTQELIKLGGNKPAFVVLNALPAQGNRDDQARNFCRNLATPMAVCPAEVGNRVAFGDASTIGRTPAEHDPSGKAADEIRQVYKYTIKLLQNPTMGLGSNNSTTEQETTNGKTRRRLVGAG
jgi:chromosome partitioning protein